MIMKIRINHKRLNIPWDGFYYFGLCKEQYEAYLSQKNKRGRPKKHFDYGNILLYLCVLSNISIAICVDDTICNIRKGN